MPLRGRAVGWGRADGKGPTGDSMFDNIAVARPPIPKDIARFPRRPNLVDYAAARADFDWAKARDLLDGLPGGRGLNIAHEAIDRHAQGRSAGRVALRWIGKT